MDINNHCRKLNSHKLIRVKRVTVGVTPRRCSRRVSGSVPSPERPTGPCPHNSLIEQENMVGKY